MWIEPATVPPRKPSRVAVASSWMLPAAVLALFTDLRRGPTSSPPRASISSCVLIPLPYYE